MKTRILSIIFVLTVFLSFTAITVNAESGTCGDNLHWSLDNDGTLTITGEGEMVIPTDPGMGPIAPWHEYSKNIKKAVISQGITNIDQYAFENCPNLENVEIPNTVTDIECGAFAGCKSITEIEIPNGVVTIEEGAFLNCEALSGFNLPNSVRYLGGDAFNSTAWYNNQPNGVVYCGNFLYGYKGEMSTVTSIKVKNGTVGICANSFSFQTNLNSLTLPNSLEYIGSMAFWGTGLQYVNIPNNVKSIEAEAFLSCKDLRTISLSANLEQVGDDAFYDTGWYNSYTSGEILYIDNWLIGVKNGFEEYNEREISDLNIKDGTVGIADGVFSAFNMFGPAPDSILSTVHFPDSLKYIGANAFEYCTHLTGVNLPENIVSIGDYAFRESGLTEILIPKSVQRIGGDAFYNSTADFTIYGYIATAAQDYALKNNITFIALDTPEIENNPVIVNVDVSKSGTNYTFDVNLTDVSDECILVTALYKNMKISEVKTTSLSANTSEKSVVMSADEADFAKVFIWNSLKKIKPLCKSVTAVIR